MITTQLMIGDWVQGFSENTFAEILEISHCGRVTISTQDGQTITLNSKDIQPIPLTKEILDKNGFYWGYSGKEEEFMSDGNRIRFGKHWVFDKGEGSISIILPSEDSSEIIIDDGCNNRNIFFSFNDRIYIHELQQALRLAGLVEIANSFKL